MLLAASLMIGAASAQTVLKSSDTHPDGYPTVEAVKYFGELVKERTGGRYAVEVYHSAQLGEEKDTIEQVRSGVIELNRVSMAPFNGTVEGNHRARRCPTSSARKTTCTRSWTARSATRSRRPSSRPAWSLLAFYDAGARSFYNKKKPINSVADMKGLKFRVIQSDIFVDMVAASAPMRRRCPMAKSIRRSRPASSTARKTTFRATTPPSISRWRRTTRSTSTRSFRKCS